MNTKPYSLSSSTHICDVLYQELIRPRRTVLYLMAVGLLAIVLFLYGFFPVNSSIGSVASAETLPSSVGNMSICVNSLYKPSIEKLVIVIIDALRWDFVGGKEGALNMPFVTSQLTKQKACLLTGKAHAPTVTMPRIKALMSGTVPNFVDVALNLGSSKMLEDNLVLQAKHHGKKIIFYGDDTWIKLFPGSFSRSEGTTSFFVSDFTEVDNNVTRHLAYELGQDDWDIMILHYLGLDHIGHLEGPASSHVRPKLNEMDNVLQRIQKKVTKWNLASDKPSLILVCGDHGMKDSGSHGGASMAEVLVPILMIGHTCPPKLFQLPADIDENVFLQIDVLPTLSVLLGLPIPASNVGKVIPKLLHHLPMAQQLYALYYNAHQLLTIYKKHATAYSTTGCFLKFKVAVSLHVQWIKSNNLTKNELFYRTGALYLEALNGMSAALSESLINFDVFLLYVTSALVWQICLIFLLRICEINNTHSLNYLKFNSFFLCFTILLGSSVLFCAFTECTSILCRFSPVSALVTILLYGILSVNYASISVDTSIIRTKLFFVKPLNKILVLGTMLHTLSLLSSSFIEEEHQVWYFLWTSLCVYILYGLAFIHTTSSRMNSRTLCWQWIVVAAMHRLLRKMNQTGDKWASQPDIGDWLMSADNKVWLSAVFIVGLAAVCYCCYRLDTITVNSSSKFADLVLYMLAAACIYCYRAATGNVVMPLIYKSSRGSREVYLLWCALMLLLVKGMVQATRPKGMHHVLRSLAAFWMLLGALLHRPHSVILIAGQVLASHCLFGVYQQVGDVFWLTAAHTWLGNVVYFQQGNSNSLASIDIASGYVGQEKFNPVTVGFLLLSNTYSAPILSLLLLIVGIVRESNGRTEWFTEKLAKVYQATAVMRILPVALYMVLVTQHRYHLFVWTVFSPKLLYESVHTAVIFFIMFVIEIIVTFVNKTHVHIDSLKLKH